VIIADSTLHVVDFKYGKIVVFGTGTQTLTINGKPIPDNKFCIAVFISIICQQ
jgi:hypothetical protein